MSKIKKYLHVIFYLVLVVYIFQFRYKLDKFGPYFTSDGAIKIFQTMQYKEVGITSLECYYPGKIFDPDFKYYPISYPWAIFSSNPSLPKCVLEYPPFFYWIGAALLYLFPLGIILYLPLLFYAISIFLFDRILNAIGFESLFRIFFVVLSFFSFPLLTSMDYTESALFLLIYLTAFYLLVKAFKKDGPSKGRDFILIGGILGFSFILRLEILIPFSFLLLFYFLIYRDIKKSFMLGIGFLIVISFFLLYNYVIAGHVLGFRYVSSIDLNENSHASLLDRIGLLKAYLWGDSVMVGIFKFNAICFLVSVLTFYMLFRQQWIREGNLFLLSGFFSIICIPFYVTFYGGVGYFGLRYLEAPFFMLIIGFSYYFSRSVFLENKITKAILFVSLGFIFYFNLVSTREGLKVLRSGSADLASLHTQFNKSNKFIIHTSLYTSIWMGNSFLNKIHILAYDSKMLEDYLENIEKNDHFLIIQSPQEIYISSDIPRKLYNQYKTSVSIPMDKLQILSETTQFGVRLIEARRK